MSVDKFKRYNRRRMLDWLFFYEDMHQEAYMSGLGGIGAIGSDDDSENTTGLTPWLIRIADEPATRISHQVLCEAVAHLRITKWRLYSRLTPVYFIEGARPQLVEDWQHKVRTDEHAVAENMALEDHEKAIDCMLEYVQQRLPQFTLADEQGNEWPMYRLRLVVPLPQRRKQRRATQKEQEEATEAFYKELETHPRADAIVRAAQESGYSLRHVRRLIQQAEEQGERRAG